MTKVQQSPNQMKAKSVTAKYSYKRGFRKSPGKILRIKDALSDIDSGVSVRGTAKKYSLSESFLRRRLSGEVAVESRNGPSPVFNSKEESELAKWLSEMAKRGMGLGPSDLLDFVQGIIRKEKRKTDFKNDRPSYTWYYNFMARNSHLVEKRKESSLENSRAKVTSKQLDEWFDKYYKFVSKLHLLDQPHRIYNADESGFSMGSKPSSVIGPTKKKYPSNPPHLCGQTKKRLTGMFCANAEGEVIPPFLIYPQPKPTAYDPLIGSRKGTVIEYTEKGWMNSKTFLEFLKHFDKYACQERPVILLIDSVSSHMGVHIFSFANSKGIELYRLQPNATHFLQPLDNGVFGPLKKVWYRIVRKFTKEHPGESIGKETFAAKLNEAFMQFYKPLTVANSFKSTGIYPVNRCKITEDIVKPAITFEETTTISSTTAIDESSTGSTESSSEKQSHALNDSGTLSGLFLLADAALTDTNNNSLKGDISTSQSKATDMDSSEFLSTPLLEALVYPSSSKATNPKRRKSASETKPDCLTSTESVRNAALKQLESVKKFARKEQNAKKKYVKSLQQNSTLKCSNKLSTDLVKPIVSSSLKCSVPGRKGNGRLVKPIVSITVNCGSPGTCKQRTGVSGKHTVSVTQSNAGLGKHTVSGAVKNGVPTGSTQSNVGLGKHAVKGAVKRGVSGTQSNAGIGKRAVKGAVKCNVSGTQSNAGLGKRTVKGAIKCGVSCTPSNACLGKNTVKGAVKCGVSGTQSNAGLDKPTLKGAVKCDVSGTQSNAGLGKRTVKGAIKCGVSCTTSNACLGKNTVKGAVKCGVSGTQSNAGLDKPTLKGAVKCDVSGTQSNAGLGKRTVKGAIKCGVSCTTSNACLGKNTVKGAVKCGVSGTQSNAGLDKPTLKGAVKCDVSGTRSNAGLGNTRVKGAVKCGVSGTQSNAGLGNTRVKGAVK